MLRVVPSLLFAAATVLSGCAGTIDVVHEARNGGTVALHGPEGGAREKAGEHMRERCPGGYEIVEEGEATVDGEREWRLTYACKGATGQVSRLAL